MPNLNRIKVSNDTINQAFDEIISKTFFRLNQKGEYGFLSKHEILGVIAEEYHELLESVKNDVDETKFNDELIDVAVACIFGLASIRELEKNNK